MPPTSDAAYRQTLRAARNAPAFRLDSSAQTGDADSAAAGRGRCNAVCAAVLASSRDQDRWAFVLAHRMCPPALRRIACHDPTSVLDTAAYTAIAAAAAADYLSRPQHLQHQPGLTEGEVFSGDAPGISGWATRAVVGPAAPRHSIARRARSPQTGIRVGLFAQGSSHALLRSAVPSRLPPAILERLTDDHSLGVRAAAAAAELPDRLLRKLAADPHTVVRRLVAANPYAPPDALVCLAADADTEVRSAVAANLAATAAALQLLACDESDPVRATAMLHPALRLRLGLRLLKDPHALGRLAVDRPQRWARSALARNAWRRSLRLLRRRPARSKP